jgi:hypothetical protein
VPFIRIKTPSLGHLRPECRATGTARSVNAREWIGEARPIVLEADYLGAQNVLTRNGGAGAGSGNQWVVL